MFGCWSKQFLNENHKKKKKSNWEQKYKWKDTYVKNKSHMFTSPHKTHSKIKKNPQISKKKKVGILYWDVMHAQSFEVDWNRRLTPCHLNGITHYFGVQLPLQGHFQKNTTDSCYKVHHCLYNIHQQHRLLVLQQDCFHIKIYKKEITFYSFLHPFRASGWILPFPVIQFFSE